MEELWEACWAWETLCELCLSRVCIVRLLGSAVTCFLSITVRLGDRDTAGQVQWTLLLFAEYFEHRKNAFLGSVFAEFTNVLRLDILFNRSY